MKVKVTYEYEVELSDSEYDDFVEVVGEEYEAENLDMADDVDGGVPVAVADWLVNESHVGNYNKYVRVTNVTYDVQEV